MPAQQRPALENPFVNGRMCAPVCDDILFAAERSSALPRAVNWKNGAFGLPFF